MILDAVEIEFHENGNTIWVHAPNGTTTLRIKCTGRIIRDACAAPVAHCDILVPGDIHVCLPEGPPSSPGTSR